MKRIIRKTALMVILVTLLSTVFVSCYYSDAELRVKLRDSRWLFMDSSIIFDEPWIFGKNSDEIQDRYGKFDKLGNLNEQGLCCDSSCSYVTEYNSGNGSPRSYVIFFDSDGIAYKIIKRDTPKGG